MADEEKQEEQTAEEKPAEEKSEKKEGAWDKERQRLDQAEANVEKLVTERGELGEQIETLSGALDEAKQTATDAAGKVDELKTQLAERAKAEKVDDIDTLDPDVTDPKVIKVIKDLKAELDKQQDTFAENKKTIDELQKTKTELLEEREKEKADSDKAQRQEKILSRLDTKYGAKFRNDAIKLAKEKVAKSGEAPAVEEIYPFLEECYEEVRAKAPQDTTKETVVVDTGKGGVVFQEGEIKEGTTEDVWPQIKKKLKAKGLTNFLPSP